MSAITHPAATMASIERYYNAARLAAITLLEQRARAVMRAHPNCTEFVCAMGSATFTVNRPGAIDGEISVDPCGSFDNPPAYMAPVAEVLDEWDRVLKLTGEGFRFAATGPVRRNW